MSVADDHARECIGHTVQVTAELRATRVTETAYQVNHSLLDVSYDCLSCDWASWEEVEV